MLAQVPHLANSDFARVERTLLSAAFDFDLVGGHLWFSPKSALSGAPKGAIQQLPILETLIQQEQFVRFPRRSKC